MSREAREQLPDRSLPHNADAERIILGAIILDNGLVNQAIELLRPDDFYIHSNQYVFRSMIVLSERDAEINPVLLGEELRRKGVLEQTGGLPYVSELTYGLPATFNVAAYAKLVREKSFLRHLIRVWNKGVSMALEEEDEAAVILASNKGHIAELMSEYLPTDGKGLFTERGMNEWLSIAAERPVPRRLLGDCWAEGELAILFADTGAGKSALTVQVAESIATGKPIDGFAMEAAPQNVLYFDFELTDMQLQKRYAVEQRADGRVWYDNHYKFSERFKRIEINGASRAFDSLADFERVVSSEMERMILADGAKVVIVDNITYLARETDKGKFALPLMQRLSDLKKQHGLSIKVLAHTPKRDETRPITINDLGGSKHISNFADSVFAIGKSSRDANLRYLKQLKARSTDIIYNTDSVAVCRFEKPYNFLRFEFIHNSSEYDHLKTPTESDKSELVEKVKELSRQGRSQRAVATELGISVGAVNKYLKIGGVHAVHGVQGINTVNSVNTTSDASPTAEGGRGQVFPMFNPPAGADASPNGNNRLSGEEAERRVWEGYDNG